MISIIEEQQVAKILHIINQSELTDEIKFAMLTDQNIKNGILPCKMIAAQPEGHVEFCDDHALDVLSMISNIRN